MLHQAQHRLHIKTNGPSLVEITAPVAAWLMETGLKDGLLTVFIRHTSASLTIQENADPDVQRDLMDAFDRLAPRGKTLYRHDAEGPDDMPAHIRAALSDTSLGIPVTDGRMVLGTWQGLYIFEHRDGHHRREVFLHLTGC
ncbi:secondary thiamine-phosphate synthase enzyme YjbQ [Eilatimonas milleporae]|uniref:Secondary thiamine-phosphate synthase enzyme n=1 Tax=Eilatimonas milleporae TaxID=911205 RepID=A0A3M0CUE7_9PROT|nr:secondary thiamine-phosphate synthase enzyme YjbQ [Eilatimonas milleporae]RMB12717.1 secondary thiamine-phosphate synthase enzyme [Eilatimonas milleporae]